MGPASVARGVNPEKKIKHTIAQDGADLSPWLAIRDIIHVDPSGADRHCYSSRVRLSETVIFCSGIRQNSCPSNELQDFWQSPLRFDSAIHHHLILKGSQQISFLFLSEYQMDSHYTFSE